MKAFRISRKLMGSMFELIVVDNDRQRAEQHLEAGVAEIQRLETLLTEFSETSETSLINRHAGLKPVQVSEETYQLIRRSIQLSGLTQGAFDITVGPLKKLYKFNNGKNIFPTPEELKNALSVIGFRHIDLKPDNEVYLQKREMKISFSAIGKGYAADCVKNLWKEAGVEHGVINASGDLTVLGNKADGQPWKIGIANPVQPEKLLCYLPVQNGSVATSGNYEQFFMKDGVRYGHTIDPVTGKPVTGIQSVTVVGPGAELCDALATAVYVMGVKVGMHFVSQLPNTHCLIIDDRNNLHKSANLNFEHV